MFRISNSKGFMPLEQALGLGLSVIALLILLPLMTNLLASSSHNDDVIESTVDSIHSYIGYSQNLQSEDYVSTLGQCYTMFQLEDLTQFQRSSEGMYDVVITPSYIGFAPQSNLEILEENSIEDYEDSVLQKKNFDTQITIKVEAAPDPSISWRDLIGIGESSPNFINLENSEQEIIILRANTQRRLGENVAANYFEIRIIREGRPSLSDSQGSSSYTPSNFESYEIQGHRHLLFSPRDQEMIIPRTDNALFLAKRSLCKRHQLEMEITDSRDIMNLDSQNRRIELVSEPDPRYKFVWENSPNCEDREDSQATCEDLIGESGSNIAEYKDFVTAIRNSDLWLYDSNMDGIKLESSTPSPRRDMNVDFGDMFSQSEEIKHENVFEENSREFETVNDEYMNKVYFESCFLVGYFCDRNKPYVITDNEVWFQKLEGEEPFFTKFDITYLNVFKDSINDEFHYFFGNDIVEYDEITVGNDNREEKLYKFEITYRGDDLEIYLTKNQLSRIKSNAYEVSKPYEKNRYLSDVFGSAVVQNYDDIINYFEEEVYLSQDIDSYDGRVVNNHMIFYKDNLDRVYFYQEEIEKDAFIRLNEDIFIPSNQEDTLHYLNLEVELEEHTLYSRDEEITVYRVEMSDVEGRGIYDAYLSKSQVDRIRGEQDE